MNVALYQASPFDAIRQINEYGQEIWSARDLQTPLGYGRWENFKETIERGKISCQNSGYESLDHFRDTTKPITGGKGAIQVVEDFHLTRFACYLTAMNGDPHKPEISAAQVYFAIKTREAEIGKPLQGMISNQQREQSILFLKEELSVQRKLWRIEKKRVDVPVELRATSVDLLPTPKALKEPKQEPTIRERIIEVFENKPRGTLLTAYDICRAGGTYLRSAKTGGVEKVGNASDELVIEGLLIKEGSGNVRYGRKGI